MICLSGYSQEALVNFGNFKMHANTSMGVYGDFTNNGSFTNNLGDLHFVGSSLQNINGSNLVHSSNLFLNNSNNVKLDNELQVSNLMTFTNGVLLSDTSDKSSEFLHFLAGSSHINASSSSYVEGVVRKTGNTQFDFPIGENGLYRPLGISAPSSITDNFTSHYNNTDPNIDGYTHGAKEPIISHVSNCEYWILDRTNGSSNVTVTLSYDNLGTAGCSGVTNQNDLLVARWDGNIWKNYGNSATTGAPSAGTITTFGNIMSFSPFTLASSININNPLPVEMLEFNAVKENKEVLVYWTTASEINSDYFVIQKTKDLNNWEDVAQVVAQGFSTSEIQYRDYDSSPYNGTSYYRLKQVDLDGEYTYSKIASVNFDQNSSDFTYSIHPNPASNIINIDFRKNHKNDVLLSNSIGQNIDLTSRASYSDNKMIINVDGLARGIYYIKIVNHISLTYDIEKIIIQ